MSTILANQDRAFFDLINPQYISWEFYSQYLGKEPPFGELGAIIYLRTYSRFTNELKRRETWQETILRNIEYSLSLDNVSCIENKQKEAEALFDMMFHLQGFPAGRSLWTAGSLQTKKDPSSNWNCTFKTVDSLSAFSELFYWLLIGAGTGFSVQQEYISQLPKLNPRVHLIHEDYAYQKRIEGTFINLADTENSPQFLTTYTDFVETSDIIKSDADFVRPLNGKYKIARIQIGDSKEDWCNSLRILLKILANESVEKIYINYDPIRPEGSLIKTFGGRASGHKALLSMFDNVIKIVRRCEGNLDSLAVLDIVNSIGLNVVSGGVRRTAQLALGDSFDDNFKTAKVGLFTDPSKAEYQTIRTMSNNSTGEYENPGLDAINKTFECLRDQGDPGFWIVGNSQKLASSPVKGTNPCITSDSWIHTEFGARQVKDLIGKQHSVYVNGELFSTTEKGFFYTGRQPVYNLKTKEGYSVKVTGNHQILKVLAQTRKKQYTDWVEASQLKPGDLIKISDHRGLTRWDGVGTEDEGWLLGSLVGDGHFESNNKTAVLGYWGPDKEVVATLAFEKVKGSVELRSDAKIRHKGANTCLQINSSGLCKLANKFGIAQGNKVVTQLVEEASYDFYKGFIRGLFDADGSVQGSQFKGVSVRLCQSNLSNLESVQRMLLRIGINSVIYKNRRDEGQRLLPDSKRENKLYNCQSDHELVVANDNITMFRDLIGFNEPAKRDKLDLLISQYVRKPNKDRFVVTVESLDFIGIEDVYDCTVPTVSRFDANGLVVHNCGEASLDDKQSCNLTTGNVRACVYWDDETQTYMFDWEKWYKTIVLVTRLGCRITLANQWHPEWDKIQKRDRLLGVSMTGVMDAFDLLRWDDQQQKCFFDATKYMAINTADEYHDFLGINRSARVCLMKPEGTISLLPTVSSGIHRAYAPYYLRRVRFSKSDPLAKVLLDLGLKPVPENGQGLTKFIELIKSCADLENKISRLSKTIKILEKVNSFLWVFTGKLLAAKMLELVSLTGELRSKQEILSEIDANDVTKSLLNWSQCNTWVFTFPIKTNAKIRAIDESVVDQLERYKLAQTYYADRGHNVSCTITVARDEYDTAAKWVNDNWDSLIGVAFLPRFDPVEGGKASYPLMPLEPCDQETYEKLKATLPTFSQFEIIQKLSEIEKGFEEQELEKGCSTGACPVR